MKALTIKQPFASLICWGAKDIENRSQRTHIRGKVLIHAGAQWYEGAKESSLKILTKEQKEWVSNGQSIALLYNESMPLSAIIGEVEIVDCVQNHPSIWAIDGYWHWVLANAVIYENPIPCKGALSFWKPQGATVDAVLEQQFLFAATPKNPNIQAANP